MRFCVSAYVCRGMIFFQEAAFICRLFPKIFWSFNRRFRSCHTQKPFFRKGFCSPLAHGSKEGGEENFVILFKMGLKKISMEGHHEKHTKILNGADPYRKHVCFSISWAAGGRTFVLEPTAQHPQANATAVIDTGHISIQARGLRPDAVYTVWFDNMKPQKSEAGVGIARTCSVRTHGATTA